MGIRSRLKEPSRSHEIGILLAAGGLLLVSLDSLGIRLAEAETWDISFWLGVFTAISMFTLVPIRTGKSLPTVALHDGWPVVASGILQTASTGFFILAVNLTAVANAVVIIAAAPVVAALIAHFAIHERTSTRTWIGIAGSIVGIVVVMSGSFGQGRIVGDLFAVAAICAFGINLTIWRRLPDLNRQVAVGLGGLGLALVSFIPADPGSQSTRAMAILAILGLITGPTGRVSIATATRYLPVSQVSLFTPVETVAAIVWAWLFLNEAPPTTAVIGGVIVIASLIYGVARRKGEAGAVPPSP